MPSDVVVDVDEVEVACKTVYWEAVHKVIEETSMRIEGKMKGMDSLQRLDASTCMLGFDLDLENENL